MNKIFKVIWSKSKQCYIVVSEIAKNKTGKKKIVVAGIFVALAMVNGGHTSFAYPPGGEGTQSAFWVGRAAGATGQNAQAEGVNAQAKSAKSIAIGSDSVAKGEAVGNNVTGATAVGGHASAIGTGAVALGYRTQGNAVYATAIGSDSSVTGQYSVGLGWKANVSADNSIAVGEQSKAVKEGSTVMGPAARGYGNGSLSIGYQALAGANVYTGAANDPSPYNDTPATINNYAEWGDTAIGLRAVATGGNATALGRSARAAAANAIAIGGGNGSDANNNTEKTEATGEKSTAIGYNAKAKNTNDIAIGMTANASDGNAIAIGRNVTSAGGASTSIGYYSSVTGNQSIGIGSTVTNSAQKATAIGYKVTVSGSGAIGIGSGTDGGSNVIASGSDAIAMGTSTLADSEKAVAIGANSKAKNIGATAVGRDTEASGASATAVGALSIANATSAAALGMQAKATQESAIAIGNTANAAALNSTVIGKGANVAAPVAGTTLGGQDSIAMGTGASANQHSSVSVGLGASSDGVRSVAIGPKASATDEDTIAIGTGGVGADKNNTSTGNNGGAVTNTSFNGVTGVNLYYGAKSVGQQSIAIGYIANAKESGIAIGNKAISDGGGGTAIGKSVLSRQGGIVVGQSSNAIGQNSVAYGNTANATNTNSVALGSLSTASGETSVAVGYNNNALGKSSVSLGNGNQASNEGAVSVGVGNSVTANNAIAIGRNTKASGLLSSAIGNGATSKGTYDVAIGSDVTANGNNSVAIGRNANTSNTSSLAIGVYGSTGTFSTGNASIAIGRDANASADNAMAIGTNTIANKKNAIALGSDSTTATNATKQESATVNGVTYNFAGATSDTGMQLSVGAAGKERQIKNVAAGEVSATSTDAINGSQLFAVASQIKPIQYFSVNSSDTGNKNNDGATGTDAIAIGPSAVSNNVGSVALGKDAIANGAFTVALGGGNWQFKGAQANGVGTTALGSNTKTQDNTNYQTAIGFGATTSAESALALGYNASASAQNAIALGKSASTAGQDAVALGSSSQAKGDSGLAIGTGAQANSKSVISLGYQANNGASNNNNGVAIGWAAGMQSNGLNNVGVGTNAGRQIIGNNNTSLGNGAGNITSTNIYTSDSIMLGTGAKVVGSSATKSIDNVIAIGKNASGSASSAIAVGINAGSSAENGVAIGPNSNVTTYNGIALGSFSKASTASGVSGYNVNANRSDKYAGLTDIALKSNLGAVSVGNSTMTRQITGVAAGTNDTDAVNIAQLKSVNLAFTGNTGSGDVNLANSKLSINGDNTYIRTDANNKSLTISPNVQNITLNNGRASASTGLADASNVAQAINNVVSGVQLDIVANKGTKTGSVNLSNQKLTVTGGNGIRTDVYASTGGQTLVIGLEPALVNATSKGISLTGDNGSTGNKYLKDGDVSFAVKGDGNLVSTSATATGVKVAVDTAKVKDLAVEAVTVSKANNISDNPITVTSKAGNNSKDYAIGIDTTKLANKTNLAYTANGGTAKTVSLAKGLNFVDGKNTVASVDSDGKVSFDLNAATKNQINTNTTDIATNKGKIATNTTNIAANTTAIARNITLGADSGARSSQSLSTGDVAFNVKGATGDFISTKMNGNTVEVSTKRAQIDSDANNGTASVTGDDGLATAKNVADAINNAVTKSAYEWKLSANGEANPTTVGKGDIVDFTGGSNITVERDNKNISVKLNKNLTNLSSVSIGNNIGETIKLDGNNGGITANHADFKDNTGAGTSIDASGIRINNGITDLTQIGMGTISLDNGSGGNTVVTTSGVTLTDGSNMSEYNAKGIAFGDATGTNTAQFGLEGISAANQQIKDVATGTADTDAVNVKQLKDIVGDQKLNISDGTKNSTVALKNQTLTVAGTGAAKATVNNQTITIDVAEGTLTPNTTNGTVTATTGVAKATEVAAAINNTNTVLGDKIATNTTNIANTIALADDKGTSTSAKSLKDGNVSFNIKGDNKYISTAASGNDVTLTVNEQAIKDAAKSASSFKVKANAHAEEEVKGGDTIIFNNGDNIEISQNGKTFTIGTAKNITVDSVTAGNTVINTSGLTSGTGASAVSFGTNGISAGNQVISNVASGNVNNNATDNSNAANIGDVKQAVANLSQNLNITDGTNNGTVDLKNQKLNVAGANGVTATVNNQTITVGLDANTVNATTKGVGLTADTGSTGNKYLKDGDVSFAVTGDGNLVSTSGTTAGVKVAVDAAKVKDLAVAAVTVSKDAQADNPITVTPTAGANSKDYAIGIDTTKLAAKTDLTYRANSAADANAKKISLSKGLNFVDGGSTVATVDNDGKVSFDLNTTTKNQINTNTTDIAANKGNITKNTAAIATNTAALARHISLGADAGTASSQSLSAADVAFNVKGATGDFVSTNMNGNTVEISTKRATINSNATTGEASVTGNDGLATAQNVADAINKAADAAKAGAAWNITTNSSTTDKTAVKGGDTVDLVNGDNIEITQDGTDKKKITVATKKDITVDSVTANNKVTVGSGANKITLDGTDGSVTGKAFTGTTFTGTSFTGTSFTAGNTVINTNGLTNGTTAITGTGVTTDNVTVGGISIDKTAGINAGNKVISNVASGGTTLTNAANIGDVQNAVANLSQNLNITDGTHDGTVDLKNQKLNVAGANGVTATVNNQTITVGLDADTVNATTKGIGLTADTGSTGNKYLKDGDVSFAVTGDGSLVSTSATTAGVKVAVNSATITAGTDGTITGPTTDGVATAKNVADAINAAKKASKTDITANTGEAANATTGNVTLTSTTAADGHTIYDVKLNDKVTLGSGANAVTIDGTSGAITGKTATIGGVTVNGTANTIGGLSNTTWNGTAVSGRAATEDQLKAATGATTLKFTGDVATNTGSVNLKDDTFGIKGDNKYISTDVNGKNVNLTVSEAEVKKSAVAAVTVSTDTTDANNPLTVTPTTSADGTTKDYKVTIDGTKIANKTNLSYKANGGTAKQVSLADGLNFKNGTLTTASIDDNGVVKYDVNTASITAGTDGTITGPTTDGVATAKNVADAINAAKKASKTEITANTGEAANATTGNVTLTSTTAADGHTIYDVKLNDKVTLGTGANAVTVDGTTGAITGKTANIGGVTVNGTANTIGGLSNTTWNGTATTGRAATEDQLKAVADAAGSQTWNITADKAGTTGNQTGTKKNATVGKDETVELVAGDNLTINQNERKFTYSLNKDLAGLTSVSIGTGTTETIKLDGATGKITAKNAVIGGVTVDGDNNHVTGLANTTWNGTATTGRAATEDQLKAVAETAKTTTDAVNLKFSGNTNTSPGVVNLKDDTLGIVGDGKYVSTDANGKNLTVKVSEAEIKKSAVAAVTVSTDTTDANNPLTVTPTTSADGTTKDYKVTIDGTKIANKTNLSYKANDGTAKQVSLADGLNFKNGTLTTASIDDAGVVKYDVNTASITAGADGTITGPTTDGVATAQNVADAINAAKKASKTEITANTGEAANATTGNVTLTSTTAADGHTIYDVKLNDKVMLGSGANAVTIDGTAGKATIGSSVINGVNNTFTTGGAKAVTLDGATGTITGTTANIGGITVNGTANTIGGLSNTTWNGTATTGRAATEDQLKAVADAAGSQTWEITADKKAGTSGDQTGTKENAKVGKDDKVSLIAGENLTVDQAGKNFTYSLNTDLVKMNSATFLGTGTNTTVITGDSITQTAGTQTNTSTAAGNTVANGTKSTETTADGQVIKDGTKINTSTVDENTIVDGARSNKTTVDSNVIDDGNGNVNTSNATSNTITDGTNTSTITAGKATLGSSVIDGVNNTFTTGGANAVKLDGAVGTIKTGTVTVTGGTTNDITGLSNTTLSATDFATKGRAATEEQLKAATGATTLKFTGDVATNTGSVNLKDDTFGIKGDGKYISTDVNGKNVNLTVSEAEVKKSAVAAVTVSTDTTDTNNPLTVTPTTSADGTTKDYKVTIDGTKIANKTNLSYKANGGTAKQVSLADGLDFTNGTLTTASIDDKGVVKYDVNTASITAGTDGTITGPTTDGVATAKNVTDAINAAKKASKTEVTANTGEAANATTGNVTLTSTTAADGHTIYDVKLNDKVTLGSGANAVTIDGTAGKATIGSSIVDGVNNTFTTGGASPVTLNGGTGTITGKTANIGGVTVDGTNNHVMGLANKDWTPGVTQAVSGRAATEDQLQKVSDAVGAGWKVNTGKVTGSTGESNGAASTKVASGEEVQFQAGNNLIVDQNGKTVAYSLNKALKDLESATFNGTGTNKTVITGDSITQTAGTQTNTSTAGGNIVADGANSTAITAAGTTVTTANGNTNYAADGVRINTTGKTPVSLTDAGLDNGNNVIKNVASGHVNNDATDNTNAANIADVKKATTTVTANTGEAANATTGNVTLTSTTAADGHTIYDVKLNDKVTLGTGANAVTINGTAGKATIGSSVIDGVNNTFTTSGANAVKLDGVAGTIKTGTVTVTGGTTNDITGLSNTTVNSADFATKGRAATEEQLKAVGEQTWQITADKDATTSGAQTGTKKDAKVGKNDKVQLIAGENMTVNQNERDFTFTLNKDLVKMNSATFLGTGSNTTVITGNSLTQTAGTQTNTSTAGGNTVADGTKSTETTAAGQVIKDGAKSNKSTVDNNVIDDGTGNVNTSNATSNTITDGTNTTATTSSSVTVKDNAGNSTVVTKDNVTTGVGGNKITLDGTAGKATVGTSVVDGVNNTFTTGGANAVKLDGVAGTIKTGTVTVTGGTTNDITGLSNTTVTAADFATKGRAATEEQLKAVGEQTWQITADKDAATSGAQTGTKKDAKVGKDDKVQLIAGENMTVNQNERDFTFTLNKDLVKMNSATFLGTGTNKTVITGNSITQTAGTQTNTSTAAGNTVVDGTKSTETTAAGQVIKDGTKSNKSTVDNNVIDDGNGNVNTSNATSNTITDGTNTSTVTAGKAQIGTVGIDGVASKITTGGANAVVINGADGTVKTGTVTVTGGTTNDITGLSNTTVTAADFATKGRAATEEQLKAVGEQTWQITADKDTATSGVQTGTKKDAKVGKDDKVQLIAGENMTVNQNERDFTFILNKDLVKMNSATFLGTGTNTTVITGNSITQTAGTQTNTSTAGGNTVVDGTKSTATTADGTTVTSANGNTKYGADGVRINTTGKNSVSLTDAGLDNGNNVIKNVASGHVNNDATDNTNAANIADVKKATTTVTANAGEAANATKGNVTLTSTTAADGHTIYDVKLNDKVTLGTGANAVTIDGTAGKATVGSSVVDGVNNTFTTGGTNAVKLDGVAGTIKTGTVTVTGGTTNDITGLSNTTVNSADFATKGRAATEEQLKAVGEQTWQITADKDATTSGAQTGTKKNAKVGKDDKVQLIAGENMTVNQNERDFTFTLNKDLVKMNSATFEATGGKTTVIKGDSIVQTDGNKTNTATASGNTVANGTKSTETTADGQVIKDGTKFNKSTVDNNVIDDGNGNVNTSNATSNTITDGTNTTETTSSSVTVKDNAGNSTVITKDNITTGVGGNKITLDGTSGKATIGSSVIDGVNNIFTTGGASPVTLNGATGTITGKTANIGGVTVDGTNNHVMGLANKDWTPGVTQAVSGRAATEDQLQKVSDAVGAGWKVNTGKVTGSTGESNGATSTKVASGEEVQFQAGNNLIVDQNGKTVAYSLNKALKDLESATFNGTGTNKTVITGDSITQTAGTQTNTSTAGGNTVADGTKSTETTADGQVIKDGAKSNKSTVDNNVIDDGTGNVNTSNATSNTITDGTNTTATTSSSVTVKDNAGNSTVITKDNITTGVGGNKITLDGTAGKATVGASVIDGVNNTFTTGGANAVKLDGVAGTIKTGTVTVTGGTTNDITGLSNTTVNSADFATKGRAATEEQLKAVGEQTWQITADKDTATSGTQTGTKKDAKVGKDDKVQLIAGENMTVNQNERDFTFTLNKDLVKMNSATFLGTGTNTTVITGDSITQTAGIQTNTSTASGNTVADGTKSTETTADGQVIKDGAKSNKSTVSSNVIDDGTGNVNTSNATSNTITDGTNTSTITAGKATIGSSIIDGVNNTFTTGGASPVTLNGATGTITGKTANIGGVTVDGTNNHVMGLANKDWTPGVTQAVSGRAATEDQLQKVSDAVGAGWKVNTGKVTGSTGESNGATSTKVASGEEVQFQAGNNLIVDQNGKTVAYSLNKALKDLKSATFNGTGTNKTVITGDAITQTAGTQTNTSTAGGNTVADGTKSTETTAAGQVIKDGAKANTSTVDENTIVDGTKSNKSTVDGNTITDGTNTTVTTSSSVTVKDNAGNSTVITKDNITTGVGGNKIILDGTAGKATIGSSILDGVNNTFTTGGANAVKLDGAAGTIKTGTVTVTGGTTNDITGLSNTTVNSADFATKGRAATEEQLKAVGEQTWQITADKDATTSGAQTGTKKNAKVGKDDKVQLIAGENMTVNQNERDFTFTLNKDLVKMNSATFLGTGTNKTVITGDSITQTAGTQTNTSTAGGNTVADGTKSTETTAAGQVIKDGTKTNTSTVDENTIVDGTKSNKSTVDGNTITDGTNTTATTSSSVTVKDNAGNSTVITKDNITTGIGANKVTLDGTAGKATVGSSVIDGVNNTFITGGTNAVKLDGAAGTIKTGTVTVTGGTTNDITGLSNTTVNSADFATKGRAATEEQLKAVGEQTWQITADKDATTSGAQTGTKKDAKVGKDDKVQLIAGENITVNQNERDFTFTLNKDLVKMNSATFLGTGTNKTVITGDSITQTAGTQTNTSTAGGNTVADGTKSTETTAAGQVIKDGAKSNKSTVDNNVIDDGNGNVNTSNATSNTITDGTNTTATTSSSVTVKDNAGNSTVITKDNITTGVGANKVTLDGTAGKATIGSSIVDGVNNTFTTGGANAVKLDGVAGTIKTGTVTVTGGTTNDITGLSNTTVTAADFAMKGRAATEEQLKAVGEQTWQITADKDTTTSGAQTGTKKDAKVGKDDKVQLIAGENMTVNQNERDFTFTLNKDLVKMNSATFLGTGSNTTVITGNSITQTTGTQTNTSTAGGNTVADGTKSTETTAAGQVIKDGAKSNKSTVDSNVIDDGNGNVNTSNATSNTITDGTNTSTITAGKANIGNIAVDGVNNKITMGNGATPVTLDGANGHLDGLTNTTWVPGVTKATTGRAATEDQLQQVSDAVGAGWKVNTGTVAGSSGVSNGAASTKVSSGEEVKLQAGDNLVIDQNGKTVSYSLNKDLTKMNSATFEATGGKTTVIKGDSIVQTDGGKTNTSNAAGNTVVDGNKSTATTAAGTTITDGAKTNTSTADKNVINDGAGNTNVSNATSNTLKNAAGDETKSDAKGVTVKDAAGNNAIFTKDGITITKTGKDTVSLTSNGLDNGKNKIVNVAAGVANTDAVNVGQLKEYAAKSTTELTANNGETAGSTKGNIVLTKTTAADGHTIYDNKLNDKITLGTDPTKAVTVDGTTGTVTGLTNKTWTPGSIVSGRAATEDQLKEAVADSGWKAAVDKEGSGQSTVVGTSPEKIKAEETVTFKAGNNMMVTQTGKSISYAVNPELTNMTSATFKDAAGNTTVTNGNGITITPGSANPTNPHAGPVSLTKDGLNNGNNQIKGVAPGTDPTDAVNVSQLNTSNANTSQAINQIAGEVQHVGAHAAAMAALKPIQYDPLEPTQVMAGVGNYRGETAAALGLAHYTNENTMFNVGVSVGGNHNMVNAGVTHKFGYSPEKKNIPDRYKAGPISSVYVMQDEVSSLKKENAEQKYVIADQAARLTTLEAENEQQRRELAETKKGLDDLKAAVDKLLASKG